MGIHYIRWKKREKWKKAKFRKKTPEKRDKNEKKQIWRDLCLKVVIDLLFLDAEDIE